MEAIRSGMNPGLTMVVGPPGTGKTDVAVQVRQKTRHRRRQKKGQQIIDSSVFLPRTDYL